MDDRSLVVATFIALLELVRRRAVRAFQEERFGPIFLERGTEEVGELPDEIPTPLPFREGVGG